MNVPEPVCGIRAIINPVRMHMAMACRQPWVLHDLGDMGKRQRDSCSCWASGITLFVVRKKRLGELDVSGGKGRGGREGCEC